jgi:uncharacterized protein GlcG (DUF336 family)
MGAIPFLEVMDVYTKNMLSLDQCLAAQSAMLEEFKKDPDNIPIAIAIVDDQGKIITYARTDGSGPMISRNSITKAYTSALNGRSTKEFKERLKAMDRGGVADQADPMFFGSEGGVVVINPSDGKVLGGIGVSGLPAGPGDEDIALVGLKALAL